MMRDKYSAEDSRIHAQIWGNTRFINQDRQKRKQVECICRTDPHEAFKKENSNIKEAKARTDGLIKKLKAN